MIPLLLSHSLCVGGCLGLLLPRGYFLLTKRIFGYILQSFSHHGRDYGVLT